MYKLTKLSIKGQFLRCENLNPRNEIPEGFNCNPRGRKGRYITRRFHI
jgi:hypothetical protein